MWNEDSTNYSFKNKLLVDINMTPFVDVCLVLLIIFMVTAPFAVTGVDVKLPKSQAKSLSLNQESIILSVTKNGSFFLGKKEYTSKNLVEALQELSKNKQESTLFIRADESVPYKFVMQGMESAQIAGINRIGMIGEKKTTHP